MLTWKDFLTLKSGKRHTCWLKEFLFKEKFNPIKFGIGTKQLIGFEIMNNEKFA